MLDRVIRGGTVVDGTGAPARRADIGIADGRIVELGDHLGAAREELDADGLLVTPGFVDVHTHYDGQATWDPWVTPSGWHGVSTVVMGNCGVGFAPVRPVDRDWLINVMEGVEDIPGSALHEGIRWEWESFPEYLDALERMPRAVDIGAQVPHSALRGYVMGRTGSETEPATPEQIAEMRRLVVESLRAGALGFSTSRTSLHRTAEGVLVAGTDADVQELLGIADAIAEVGHGVFEMADEHARVPADMGWIRELARRTGQPVCFNLSQIDQAPDHWRRGLDGLEAAHAAGERVYGQVAGRAIGILMTWHGTAHPFVLTETWRSLDGLPWPEKLARLRDPAVRAKMITDRAPYVSDFHSFVTQTFGKMFPVDDQFDYEPGPERSLKALAGPEGPAALAYDLLMADDGNGLLFFPLFNYSTGGLDVVHTLHSHPATLMGLSDGGAHCGAIGDAGMPTFMLSFWARDRSRGPKLPLEYVVHRQTQQTARFYGLEDRGVLAPGYRADLNVIDFDKLALNRPKMAWDLPAGGRRLIQTARGYVASLVAGEVVSRDGEFTGAMPGRLVRGPQRRQ